jgi:3-oxoacyl-[acyl-carrier protein] reductase
MNPVALVTGGSRGIGRGIALELASLGYDLVINYARHEDAAAETAAACQGRAPLRPQPSRMALCQADIGLAEDRQRLVQFIQDRCGRLDLLVNNAGVAPEIRTDLLEATEESFDRLLRINVKGPYFLTQKIARWMIAQTQSPERPADYQPKIVTVTSVSAYAASTNRGDYCLSKAALSMLTPLFASRLAAHGIQVFEVRPGIIATDMTSAVKEKYDRLIGEGLTPIPRWGQPEDVGRAVAAIARNSFPFSTGEVINVDGGFHLRRL